jgi:hypothetical protein
MGGPGLGTKAVHKGKEITTTSEKLREILLIVQAHNFGRLPIELAKK